MRKLTLCIIASRVSTPDELPATTFIIDEIRFLVKYGLNVHVIRAIHKNRAWEEAYGALFYNMAYKTWDSSTFAKIIKGQVLNTLIGALPTRTLKYALHVILMINKINKINKIDILHAHFLYPEGFIGLLAKEIFNLPLVVTVHGYELNVIHDIGYGLLINPNFKWILKRVLEKSDLILAASKELACKARSIAPNARIVHFPNAVDVEMFKPSKDFNEKMQIRDRLGIEKDAFVLINTKHLNPVYDHVTLIKALFLIKKMNEKLFRRIKLLLLGNGVLKRFLEKAIQRLNLYNTVRMLGYVPRITVPLFLRASDVYVNCSLSESSPLAILEAMAAGLPIIATNVGDTSNIVLSNGYLIRPRDYKSLAFKIINLMEDRDEAKVMSIESRKIAERFSLEKKIIKLIAVYEKLIQSEIQ